MFKNTVSDSKRTQQQFGARIGAALVFLFCSPVFAANTYQVGSGQTYASIHDLLASITLAPGDLVLVNSGTYNEVVRWQQAGTAANPITIRGVGATRPLFDATGLDVGGSLPNPRAIFQVEASNITIDNFEFINAANGNNGAGVRVTGAGAVAQNVVIRNCKITYCDMGMQSDNNDTLLVDSCEVAFNGTASNSGYSHNFYLNGNKSTIQYCYIHDSLYGQNFKTRGHYTELFYNTIANSQDGEVGLVDAAGNTDTANSNAVMIGNIVVGKVRGSAWNHARFVQFGQDGGNAHTGTLYAINNTFYTLDTRTNFIDANATGASAVCVNNIFLGSDTILQSGSNPITGGTNWAQSTAVVPGGISGTVQSTSPNLANVGARDYHLLAGSSCIDAGTNAPSYQDGNGAAQSGIPTFEYVIELSHVARPSAGTLDIGAYEFPLPLSISTTSVPPGTSGAAYSVTLNATGGATPYTWSLSSGSLPANLTLSAAGVVSGSPGSTGNFSFTALVTDNLGATAAQAYTLTVNAPVVPPVLPATTLPPGTVGVVYSQTIPLNGGTAPFTWSVSSGSLPAGLSLTSGNIVGTPSTAVSANFNVQVVDANNLTAIQSYTLIINAPAVSPVLPATTLPLGTVGVAYSQTIPLNGGTAPFTWSVSSGSLPAGLSLSSGNIAGTPSTAVSANFNVQVVDANNSTATQSYTLTINPVNQSPVIESSPTFMPNPALAGQSITFNVSASDTDGDALSYAWTFGEGGTGSSATPSYVYVAAGTYAVQVTITDASGLSAVSSISVVVNTSAGDGNGGGGTGTGSPDTPLKVSKLQGFANFKASGHDWATLQGILANVAPLFDPTGKSLSINLDGAAMSFILDRNGRGKSGQSHAALIFKPTKRNRLTRKNQFQGGNVAFSIRLQNGSWAALWKLDPNSNAPVSMTMPVTVQLGGITYQATVPVSGTSKAKSGAKFKLAL